MKELDELMDKAKALGVENMMQEEVDDLVELLEEEPYLDQEQSHTYEMAELYSGNEFEV